MNTPRPIGTEVEYAFEPSRSSSNPHWSIWRYRIVAHDQIINAWGQPDVGERLEPIDERKYFSTRYVRWFDDYKPVPPPEVLPYLGDDWKMLAEYAERQARQ